MLPAAVQQSAQMTSGDQRRHERFTVRVKARLLAENATSQFVIINDISAGGVGLDGVVGIHPNDQVRLELPDGRVLSGTVVWWISGCCGVQFDSVLDESDPILLAAQAAP